MHVSNTPTSNLPDFQGTIDIHVNVNCPVDTGAIPAIVGRILADAGFRNGTISIAIVDDTTIHRLNRQYLQHDYPTDVLSFLLDSQPEQGRIDGEVIVSDETARRQAPQYGWSADEERLLYIVHGTLHLAGLDDATDALRAEMQNAEDQYLTLLGISRPHPGRSQDPAQP
jgi:probable rRNA maturation factor